MMGDEVILLYLPASMSVQDVASGRFLHAEAIHNGIGPSFFPLLVSL